MRAEFHPGERVTDPADGRSGVVVTVDWGAVYVDMDETRTEGKERRACNAGLIEHEGR